MSTQALALAKQELDRLKRSPEIPISMAINSGPLARLAPASAIYQNALLVLGKLSAVFTNVPGPPTSCRIVGEKVGRDSYRPRVCAKPRLRNARTRPKRSASRVVHDSRASTGRWWT